MKRQRGRNRGGNGPQGGGGKPQQHNANRSFESNGPDNVKIRGNAQHVFEKYQQLARDASSSGDRVLAENYLQHAEHYFRVVRAVQPNRPVAEIIGRDSLSSGYDIDFEAETGANAEPETASEAEQPSASAEGDNGSDHRQDRGEWQSRDNRDRSYNRDDRPREERPYNNRDDRGYNRDDRPRNDQSRNDQPREERQPREDRSRGEAPRNDQPRNEQPRNEQSREDRPSRRDRYGRDRFDRPARDPMAVVEPESTPLTSAPAVVEEGQRQLRSQDGSLSPAPAFLQARPEAAPRAPAPEAEDAEPARKPRRRRTPRTFEGGDGEASPAAPETEEA
jgi:hypothetical protein